MGGLHGVIASSILAQATVTRYSQLATVRCRGGDARRNPGHLGMWVKGPFRVLGGKMKSRSLARFFYRWANRFDTYGNAFLPELKPIPGLEELDRVAEQAMQIRRDRRAVPNEN